MSKKLKRSAVALVLAATMVFSSQGVLTAFAVGENETSTAVDVSALEPILDKEETDVANESGNVNDDPLENVCEICGGADGQHTEDCTVNQQPENTCPVCSGVDGQHEEGCSANQQPENTCPVCGGVDGQHTEDCTANQQPDEGDSGETTCPVCGGVDGQHTEDCTANQQPDEGDSGETTCPECGGVDGQHEENCSLAQESDNTPSEEDVAAAKNVSDLIGALPEASTLDPETTDVEALTAQVKAAREAYDKLTDAQKALVERTVLDKLVALEGALEGLEQVETIPDGMVACINGETYATLDAAIEAATDGATIELLADCTTAGLDLHKSLTITAAEGLSKKPTVTFTDKGIALWGISLTFKNCDVVMNGIGSTPYTAEWGWMTICASVNASLTLDNVNMTMDATGTTNSPHAIYFCQNNVLNIISGSNLTIKNYANDALEWDGGNGGYNVNITDSTFISDHNRSGFTGTFYATITNSDVDVINSTGNGSNGSHFIIENSNVNFSNNGSHGLSAGELSIDNSIVTCEKNGGMGISVNDNFEVKNNSKVTVTENALKNTSNFAYAAVRLYNNHTFTVDKTSKLYINNNHNTGLYVRQGNLTVEDGAVLEIIGNNVENNLLNGYGGGIYVGYGDNYDPTVVLPADAKIYNNHALVGGDDIYVSEGVNGPSLTFGKVGEGWTLDGDPDCTDAITGWFDDSEGNRWEAHDAPYHINEFVQFERNGLATVFGLTSLKAAHGIDPIDPGEPGGGDWDENHSKSKTATPLDANYESDVTLSLPSAEEQLVSDVVFVLDKSTSTDIEDEALAMLEDLKEQIAQTGAKVNVGVVIFNREAHPSEWFDLATQYEQIESAIRTDVSGGTNTHAGLLAAQKMLDAHPSIAANRKYVVFVSDGLTYLFDEEVNAINSIQAANGEEGVMAGNDCWGIRHYQEGGDRFIPDDWNSYLTNVGSKIGEVQKYIQQYDGMDKSNHIPKYNTELPTTVDVAMYKSYSVFNELMASGYHCYVMKADSAAAARYPWGPAFMQYLQEVSGNGNVNFSDIQNDIFYLLDAGSSVVDVIGYGIDNADNEYNFDFVDNLDNLKITVGGNELDEEDIIDPQFNDPYVTSSYGFYDPASGRDGYDFVLKYYQKGQDGNSDECFVWEINVPVSNFAPVQLTYTVKLTNPQTAEGTYGEYDANGENGSTSLYTNKEATLYPVDSNGDSGVPENFPKPTVSYTVGGNDNPGTDPTPDPDPDPDRPSRPNRDDDDDWEPLPDAPVKDKPTTEVDVPEETETPTTEQPDKYNPETGDTTTVFAAMALAAVSLGGVVLLGRKKK